MTFPSDDAVAYRYLMPVDYEDLRRWIHSTETVTIIQILTQDALFNDGSLERAWFPFGRDEILKAIQIELKYRGTWLDDLKL